MTNKKYLMIEKELNIKTVMDRLLKLEITEEEAAKLIKKSLRQTQRIKRKYKLEWIDWLIHKLRWKKWNRQKDGLKYIQAIQIIKEKYIDYWPTLASEKLFENHNLNISIPILRREMILSWIWKSKTRKLDKKQFTARERKQNYWELVQYDWSYHMWFEWRNWTWYQCLLVSVDDASWEVRAKFAKNEWLTETSTFWKEYIEEVGKPIAIYLDKFATYKVNYPWATDDKELPTQFWRSTQKLWIKLIFANTPQAKWRVERMNQTLQDRLVKELRENNICDFESANKFLKEVFLPKFNNKFMLETKWKWNLHTQLNEIEKAKLNQIFSKHIERKVANDYTIKYNSKFYQLYKAENKEYRLNPWQKVCIEIHLNWDIMISYNWIYITSEESFERPEKQNTIWISRKWNILLINQSNEINSVTIQKSRENEYNAKLLVWEKEDHYYMIQ